MTIDEGSITTTSQIDHRVLMVDSARAEKWLARNKNNRTVREYVVLKYRSDMNAGRWTYTGDPIRFDVNGNLLDGQHRLRALSGAISGIVLPMMVIRGLPVEAQFFMDQGIVRTPGDQLGLKDIPYANTLASVVRVLIEWEEGFFFKDVKASKVITSVRIEQWVEEHPEDVKHFQEVAYLLNKGTVDAPPRILGAVSVMFGRVDQEKTKEFLELLRGGAGTAGNPLVTLDKKLQLNRRNSIKVTMRDHVALFVQAWNAWRDGRTPTYFPRPPGARWEERNFPVPH
jgi:hypothetical protein